MTSYLEDYQDKYASFEHLITNMERDVYRQFESIFKDSDCVILDNPSLFMEGVLHAYANDHNSLCYYAPINKQKAKPILVCMINKTDPTIRVPKQMVELVIGRRGWRIKEIKEDSELDVNIKKVNAEIIYF